MVIYTKLLTVPNNIANNVNGHKQDSNNNDNEGDNNQSNNQDNNTDNTNGNNNNESSGNELVWGVDSASLTTDNLLACVQENYGTPEIWGRYLGDKEGVSTGITPEEVDLLHSNDIKILVIWNHFTDATGFENGQNVAREAIQKAQEDGVPEGVALFADIEPTYPVDSDFIRGWYQVMSESEYNPGIYGSFDSDTPLYQAFQQASETNAEIKENTYIWTAVPKVGITTEANAPDYQPSAPEDGLIAGWQYGIEAQTCNIDTNLFNSNVLDGVLW
ncbi:glycoside hydrolase domain-containing protein [Halobacillus amylolyticus]|uniref:DUF1906 domain-containing protein n=1 Tax=Halobacillus amylolyticus TaxID=2932259 RepID=A0ABY4H7S2_9BACI|nr:glycoside hydrolase domain-containing protein [Halobacillus amylolyticus]UOR10498.1 DUF1906 domain-containing protein [Halobacillus amylolyticus]